ncbi:FmdB family zinc ribbon protein [Desulforhopalus sp. 52FAK]
MPIYEYFCTDCNVVFSFMSSKVAPSKIPDCPRCSSGAMIKQLSAFTTPANSSSGNGTFDEDRVESAFTHLLEKAEHVSEHNACEVGGLLESFTKECGYEYTGEMRDKLSNMSTARSTPCEITPHELLMKKGDSSVSLDAAKTEISDATVVANPPEIDPNIYKL